MRAEAYGENINSAPAFCIWLLCNTPTDTCGRIYLIARWLIRKITGSVNGETNEGYLKHLYNCNICDLDRASSGGIAQLKV
jgi:hypothetical protein